MSGPLIDRMAEELGKWQAWGERIKWVELDGGEVWDGPFHSGATAELLEAFQIEQDDTARRVGELEVTLREIAEDMEGVLRAQAVIDAPYPASDVPRRVAQKARAALASPKART